MNQQPGVPMQSLGQNPGNLPPISVDPNLLHQSSTNGIMSIPQSFCFPTAGQIVSGNMSSVPSSVNSVSTPTQQLNSLSMGSLFGMNQGGLGPQFVQPLTVAQQQALALSLNQQTAQHQNFTVPQSMTLTQAPQNISLGSQALPLGQVVVSSISGTPNINFVSPALITVSGPSGSQSQFLSNPFGQFPIMLGNQASLFNSLNTANALVSQSSDLTPSTQAPNLNSFLHLSQAQQDGSAVATLNSQPISVFSFPSPAMSVAPLVRSLESSQRSSPDTTNTNSLAGNPQLCSTIMKSGAQEQGEAGSAVSSSTPTVAPLSSTSESTDPQPVAKTEVRPLSLQHKEHHINIPTQQELPHARMKFTPVDSEAPKAPAKKKTLITSHEDKVPSVDSSLNRTISRVSEESDRDSPSVQGVVVKEEPYEGVNEDDGEDRSSKLSHSPSDSLESAQKLGHFKEEEAGGKDVQGELADVEDLEETEFVWEDYLRETGASAVPPTAFKHVELSLQSGFSKGMKLEAPNKVSPNTYWVATVVMTCGPLLRLRYEGYNENSSADFWSDPMTSDIHHLGWCEQNNKSLQPPDVVKEKYPNWQDLLDKSVKGAVTAPAYLLDRSMGATPVDQIKEGMRLEIQEELRPDCLWLVKIIENIGGRLYLRHEGLEGASQDFWLFYLDERLHPIGWGKDSGYRYAVPEVVKNASGKTEEELLKLLQSTLDEIAEQKLPSDIFNDQLPIEPHSFEVGMKLEAVDYKNSSQICAATVVQVVDSKYFIIEIDTSDQKDQAPRYCCHLNSPMIFPINWAASRGIKISPPKGYEEGEFKWSEYLKSCNAVSAPEHLFNLEVPDHEFECGMKLEAVKPSMPSQICAATITKIVEHLVWVHLDSSKALTDVHVESVHSLNLFPIGWCVSNGYQLKPPCRQGVASLPRKRVAVVQPEMADNQKSEIFQQSGSSGRADLYGGPQIYFNHRCFSGPYLSKGRIAELPRSVGPGPVTLVMKEVLTKLINTAYKSCRVLRELQLEGRPDPTLAQQMLKAKYKGKSYRAMVEICRTASQLEDFCRKVCTKLECCPNLISPHFVGDNCPENCAQLTKTKYTYYYGKRKKIGRPPGGHTNLENGEKKPGKRRRRKRIGMIAKRSSRPTFEDQGDNPDDDKASVCSDTRTADSTSTSGSKEHGERGPRVPGPPKRRYTHHIPPPSEIQTRGAKLPKYSFEKRTHKKIMIVEGSQQESRSRKDTVNRPPSVTMGVESSFSSCPRPDLPVALKSEPPLKLEKNPLDWTVAEVSEFLKTTDCSDRELVAKLKSEEIDGQALLLLTLPNVQEYMGIKLGPAIKLCHLIERIKIAFYETFAK